MRFGFVAMVGVLVLGLSTQAQAQMPNESATRAARDAATAVPKAGRAKALEAHDYVVFFPADKADLTPQAEVVVGKAARAVKDQQAAGKLGHVKVIGYSDATNAPDAAGKLAQARAETIRKALAAAGIAPEIIRVEGRGKLRPKGAKPDAIRELVNRRARIVLYGPGG